jgi:hypothetical protein
MYETKSRPTCALLRLTSSNLDFSYDIVFNFQSSAEQDSRNSAFDMSLLCLEVMRHAALERPNPISIAGQKLYRGFGCRLESARVSGSDVCCSPVGNLSKTNHILVRVRFDLASRVGVLIV